MRKLFASNSLLPYLIGLICVVSGIAGYYFETAIPPLIMMIIGIVLGGTAVVLFYIIIYSLGKWGRRLPLSVIAAILSTVAAFVLVKNTAFRWPDVVYYPTALLAIGLILLFFVSINNIILAPQKKWYWIGIGLPVLLVVIGLVWLQQEGSDPFDELPPAFSNARVPTLSSQGVQNPASPGNYEITTFTYGSGHDQRREEYAEAVSYQTPTVDASRLLPDWKGKKKKWRERYWEFGVNNFPLNGRVYMPVGEGPFALILIVHGNHSMIDYSDDGYGYLGELLASRGFITVSVDENFINGHWSGDFRGKEMPVRAWLLLKHLEQWESWNQSSTHDLAGKVDMDNIMLIGHSRGGEAVSIAATFNELPYFPDDAREQFDFNFNIRGVVAIAPTDYRYHRQITLPDVNFLSLQGSYDADEASFWGMRPYRRLNIRDASKNFKAGVYLHRANHGQFNATWGRADFGGTMQWLLNTQPMMSAAEQQEAAKVFIATFAEAVLHQEKQYLPVFQNATLARDWLPEEYYLTHFKNADAKILVDFEEDINLATASKGITLNAENVLVWREETLSTRTQESQENNALVLGWDYGTAINQDSLARYDITLPDTVVAGLNPDSINTLLITFAPGDIQTLNQAKGSSDSESQDREEPVLDVSIVLTDRSGQTLKTSVRNTKPIAPRLKTRFTKLAFLDKDMIGDAWEVQPQTFHLPIRTFIPSDSSFQMEELHKISLVFDQNSYGVVVIDDIGFGF